ncbi:recombinase family protein [Lentzea kentuckyensis]|uniref:recombinase family protein n=1 Tax=Lentzea kentuckyensis TaxID=360086 RepID=UPI001FE832C9|nr:recombinase family protein [Lentzea kentuckyensis]
MRFAFYGRMSTSVFQDVQTSRAWQRAVSDELVDGVGSVVAEFFDVGVSRRWSWSDRPEAAALLTAAAEPSRDFDAVVVGEYERAFHGDQFREVVTRLNALGVAVWLPEAGGPVELGTPVHEALMVLLGAQAQREVARARQRVLAAMRAQTRVQGRFLGGRPPYGYRLVDGGRHPNPVHGRWGRRVQVSAPWVRWMFAERARGRTVASLVRELNDRGVVCPSGADRERNAHRSGKRWIVRTVAMILENPRYTGRQVWNRSSTTGHGPGGRPGGRGSGVLRWNPVNEWEVSERIAHEPLVDNETFVAVQGMRVAKPAKDGAVRCYMLAGLVVCGLCGRRMDGHWVHGRAGYRCRHGFTSAKRRSDGEPRNLYVREDHLLKALPHLLERTARPMEVGVVEELVDQVREQRLQIYYDDQRLEIRPAPLMPKTVERALRSVQPALALDWCADVKMAEI